MNIRSDTAHRPVALRRAIYLDHHATTPVDRRVADVMVRVMTEQFGNPNDRGHVYGDEARRIIDRARVAVGELFNAPANQVFFAGSATTAVNRLLDRLAAPDRPRPMRVATTTIEHHGVLDALARLERTGRCEIRWLEVDQQARITPAQIETALTDGCDLLCVMAANNEVGSVNPIRAIARLAADRNVPLLVDASQAAAHVPIDVSDWEIGYLLVSAHKMYGPKGIAAVVTSAEREAALRGMESEEGTPNVPAIAGFAEACRLCALEMAAESARLGLLRDKLEAVLRRDVDGLIVNGDASNRLPHNLHVSVPGVPNEAVVARLFRSVALSTGSACRSGTDLPSHVLQAMRLPQDVIEGALRIGLGRATSEEEIEEAAVLITAAVSAVRLAMRGEAPR
ncbi:cysteine desulfurase family protein [Bradyrhizobium sp. UFLA05-109]